VHPFSPESVWFTQITRCPDHIVSKPAVCSVMTGWWTSHARRCVGKVESARINKYVDDGLLLCHYWTLLVLYVKNNNKYVPFHIACDTIPWHYKRPDLVSPDIEYRPRIRNSCMHWYHQRSGVTIFATIMNSASHFFFLYLARRWTIKSTIISYQKVTKTN